MKKLTRCSGCERHTFGEKRCPFCGKESTLFGPRMKVAFAAAAGAAAFISGIGCAYGCPDGDCSSFSVPDDPTTSTDGAVDRAASDVSVRDATDEEDADARASTDAGIEDAPSDASLDGG